MSGPVEIRRRTPAEVEEFLDANDDTIRELIPDDSARTDFKRYLVAAASEFAGRERIGRS